MKMRRKKKIMSSLLALFSGSMKTKNNNINNLCRRTLQVLVILMLSKNRINDINRGNYGTASLKLNSLVYN